MYSTGLEINIFSRSLQVSPSPSPSSTSFFANVYFARISLILYVLAHILHIYLRVHAYNFQYQRNFHRLNCRQATSGTRRTSTLRFSRWFEIHGRRGLNEILVSSLRRGEVRWRGEDRVSAQLSKDFQGSLEGDMSLEYPLENVSSIIPPAWWPSGCGERRSRAELKAKRELAGRETRFLAAGDPDRADSAAFFRTIDARQNFRPSLPSSLYFLPSSPFLVLPFFAMEGEKAARRAYVTLHLHNAAANCQCGRQLRK